VALSSSRPARRAANKATVAIITKESIMIRARILPCSLTLACSVLIVASLPALADDKKDQALSGVWVLKGGELKMEFAEKNALKISPHGDSDVIMLLCEYALDKEGRVKVKITGFEGKDEAKESVKNILPLGTQFSFQWKIKDDTAKLDDIKGDQAEHLKAHLEGEYSQKK
jgi:hypothetical protein